MLISIIYGSGWGHTPKPAQRVVKGASRVAGVEARPLAITEDSILWTVLKVSDAIVFGSPTYNAPQNGDKRLSMALFAAQHGMLWVIRLDLKPGNHTSSVSVHDLDHLGSCLDAMAQSYGNQGPGDSPILSDLDTMSTWVSVWLRLCTDVNPLDLFSIHPV